MEVNYKHAFIHCLPSLIMNQTIFHLHKQNRVSKKFHTIVITYQHLQSTSNF